MELENIIVEYRHRLQSAYVFISFVELINNNNLVKIKIIDNQLVINIQDKTFNVVFENNMVIKNNSITNLKVEDRFVSFRVESVNDYMNMDNLQIDSVNFAINIIPNCNYTLICAHCNVNLSSFITFKRVLELPSERLDMDEWFCHKHGADETVNDNCSSIGSKNYNKFDPNIADMFYGQYFMLINNQNLINFKQDKSIFECFKCLHYVGESTSHSSVKLWNENILFLESDKKSKPFFKGTSLLDNFDCIIKKHLNDLDFGMPSVFNNILITSKNHEDESKYLLIQVIDKNLNIFKKNHATNNFISLKNCKAIKVLYKIPTESEDEQLLTSWKNDMNVIMIEVSFAMLNQATESLDSRCLLLPLTYRLCNNFKCSFLGM